MNDQRESVETLVIGGGQAGLAVGHHLARRDLPFVIVDANERIGDAWRNRWDSLRLFTPNRFNGLPGMPFPGPRWGLPTKDEFADYLESYAERFELPVRCGVEVERLARNGDRFTATAGDRRLEADNVVVAMSSWQRPRVPHFASDLDPRIVQLHVADYGNPGQLQEGDALVVGAGNSGAEIALELAGRRRVWLSGPDEPKHDRGVVESEPGLYFVGLKFLYSKSSEQIHGVGRDAARIADMIAARHEERVSAAR